MTGTASRLMSRADLADRLNVSVRTLENWERRGFGPAPVRLGRSVRYNADDVSDFLSGLSPQSS